MFTLADYFSVLFWCVLLLLLTILWSVWVAITTYQLDKWFDLQSDSVGTMAYWLPCTHKGLLLSKLVAY